MGDEIEDRLIEFGVRIIKLSKALPSDYVGKHVSGQILRSGTSPAPNYAEARGAESKADFVHKLGIVLKELNETKVWIRMIERAELIALPRLSELKEEATELSRIVQASVRTLRSKK